MNQIKFYKYAIWALVVLNMVVLAFFLLTKPRHPHHSSPKKFQSEVVKTLNLSSQQEVGFKKLAREHHQKMKSMNEQQQKLLLPYFENLIEPSESIEIDSLLNQSQQLEREKIELTHQHFQDLKQLLNKEQQPLFKGLMRKFIDKLLLG